MSETAKPTIHNPKAPMTFRQGQKIGVLLIHKAKFTQGEASTLIDLLSSTDLGNEIRKAISDAMNQLSQKPADPHEDPEDEAIEEQIEEMPDLDEIIGEEDEDEEPKPKFTNTEITIGKKAYKVSMYGWQSDSKSVIVIFQKGVEAPNIEGMVSTESGKNMCIVQRTSPYYIDALNALDMFLKPLFEQYRKAKDTDEQSKARFEKLSEVFEQIRVAKRSKSA